MSILIPFAEHKLIPPGINDPRIDVRIGILHVDADNAYDLEDYFRYLSGGIESHAHVPKDGKIFQYRDLAFEADANYRANPFAFSIETQGYNTGTWNDLQLATLKRTILWSVKGLGIPLRKATSWDDPRGGWGYHTMYPEWHPKPKSCPGAGRIKQFNDILVPWMAQAAKQGENMAGVPNFEERMIESNTRLEEMLRAVGAKTGADIKSALERAQATNDARDEREGR